MTPRPITPRWVGDPPPDLHAELEAIYTPEQARIWWRTWWRAGIEQRQQMETDIRRQAA